MKKLILLFLVTCSFGAQWNPSVAARDTINYYINTLSAWGDTINMPADTVTWASGITITNKKFKLIGSGIATTVITLTASSAFTVYADTTSFRISGFTLSKTTASAGWINVTQTYATSSTNYPQLVSGWRVDHVRFNFTGSGSVYAMLVDGYFKGLIDSCYFYNNGGTYIGMRHHAKHGSKDVNGLTGQWGDQSWLRATGMGTDDAIFMEDCTVQRISGYTTICDGGGGSRIVIRYNTFIGTSPIGVQIHGTGNPGRGAVYTEVYNNIFSTANPGNVGIIRSGTGVIYNNTVTGTANFQIDDPRTCSAYGPYPRCDGDYANDGNTADSLGWPCMDQIGRGAGTDTSGTNNISEPLYFWNNTDLALLYSSLSCSSPSQADHIKQSRDYYTAESKPNYSAYTYPHPLRGEAEQGGEGEPSQKKTDVVEVQ